MLGIWRTHFEYQEFVSKKLLSGAYDQGQLIEHQAIISKLWILNLDTLKESIAYRYSNTDRYSNTGRPSEHQPEFFCAFVLMQHLGVPISQWVNKLSNNFVVRTICGFHKSELPCFASFYSFIERIVGPETKPKIRRFKRKPKLKFKQGEKLKPKHPNITQKLKKKILKCHRFNDSVADILNMILSLAVNQSTNLGLVEPTINVSGDGTCILTGASSYGKKICECKSNGIYSCDCPRKFSDPTATWGWDSHNENTFMAIPDTSFQHTT